MIVLLFIAMGSAALLAAGVFDEILARRYPAWPRTFAWLMGETATRREPHAASAHLHLVTACPFCHGIPPYHEQGCSPLDRLDTPRPREAHK